MPSAQLCMRMWFSYHDMDFHIFNADHKAAGIPPISTFQHALAHKADYSFTQPIDAFQPVHQVRSSK